jgi:hypothetical protein
MYRVRLGWRETPQKQISQIGCERDPNQWLGSSQQQVCVCVCVCPNGSRGSFFVVVTQPPPPIGRIVAHVWFAARH